MISPIDKIQTDKGSAMVNRLREQFDLDDVVIDLDHKLPGDGLTNGFAIPKRVIYARKDNGDSDRLMRIAYEKRTKTIHKLQNQIFAKPTVSKSSLITNWGDGSVHRNKLSSTRTANPYYNLAYTRQINEARAFRHRQLKY